MDTQLVLIHASHLWAILRLTVSVLATQRVQDFIISNRDFIIIVRELASHLCLHLHRHHRRHSPGLLFRFLPLSTSATSIPPSPDPTSWVHPHLQDGEPWCSSHNARQSLAAFVFRLVLFGIKYVLFSCLVLAVKYESCVLVIFALVLSCFLVVLY